MRFASPASLGFKPPPASRRLSRGRSALAWAVGLFLSIQLTGGLLLAYAWPDVCFPSLGRLRREWRSRPDGPEVLCVGSSRFGMGLRPSVMERPSGRNSAVRPRGES